MSGIRFSYALNQWKPQFDDFVRREEHERALKTISIAGFEGVELSYGTGRWEPFGNPQQVEANFGSLAGFREFLASCALDAVSSWAYDPSQRSMEHLTGPLSPLSADDVPAIVEKARWFAGALAELGGSVLLVPAAPPAGDVDPLDDDALGRLAACWEAVGRATAEHGVRTALHVDFLSALRRDHVPRLLDRTDPALVGLALDTGELAVGGIDPLAVIERNGDRIWHVQFQDALAVDDAEEYLQPHAYWTVRVRGGAREVPRWFAEPGHDDGLVDFPAVTRALLAAGYEGWIVFESQQSPHPAASALLGGYLLQRELRPMLEHPLDTVRG
ncbi:sugar phosphate isomerase/epimerase family protein [Geodermatophilus sp. SYSU D00691]